MRLCQRTDNPTCDIRFSLQGRYAGDPLRGELEAFGITNNAVLIHMEPGDLAPRHLGGFGDEELATIVEAYKTRIRVARQRLGGSGAKLGLYQVIVPDGKGRANPAFLRSMKGYREAGRLGMYDDLDYIVPVLYVRFGPHDGKTGEEFKGWVDDATRQAIDASLTLTRSNRRSIPLCPILSFWVLAGPNTVHNRDAISPETMLRQLRIVRGYCGIGAIVLWSAWETVKEMTSAEDPVEPIIFRNFLAEVGELPPPGCT